MSTVSVNDLNFEAEVLKANVVLVDFGASWCAPCYRMKPLVEELSNSEDIKVCVVDVDDSPLISQRYNIRSVPTFILFKNGVKVGTKSGMMSFDELVKFVTQQ